MEFYESELVIKSTPQTDNSDPDKITIETFVDNGSTVLSDFNAPITLVEFRDY